MIWVGLRRDEFRAHLGQGAQERAAQGEPPLQVDERPEHPGGGWLIVAPGVWGPYLYWVFIEWNGDFARVGNTFAILTAACSASALLAAWLVRGRGAVAVTGPD